MVIKSLSSYIPHDFLITLEDNEKYYLLKDIIDKEFRKRDYRWKTSFVTDYDDFFQIAFAGSNPYEKNHQSEAQGALNSIKSYKPEKETDVILNIGGIDQMICPLCKQRGETTSFWENCCGNNTCNELVAPKAIFSNGNKYCGRKITENNEEVIKHWDDLGLIRKFKGEWYCNHINKTMTVKNFVVNNLYYLIQNIRNRENSSKRSYRKKAYYHCPHCNVQVLVSNLNKKCKITCSSCKNTFDTSKERKVWENSGIISLNDKIKGDEKGDKLYDEIIQSHSLDIYSKVDIPISSSLVESQKSNLLEEVIDRLRYLAAKDLSEDKRKELIEDSNVLKDKHGIPETILFKIFYDYFFADSLEDKKSVGKINNIGDESTNYRRLALKYLNKELHFSQCQDCKCKVYESQENSKIKRNGTCKICPSCSSKNIVYHKPGCKCGEHGNVEVIQYAYQAVEFKIRRLEEKAKKDKKIQELCKRIREFDEIKSDLRGFEDFAKIAK